MSDTVDDRKFRRAFGDIARSVDVALLQEAAKAALDEVRQVLSAIEEDDLEFFSTGPYADALSAISGTVTTDSFTAGSTTSTQWLTKITIRAQRQTKYVEAIAKSRDYRELSDEELREKAVALGDRAPSPDDLALLMVAIEKLFNIDAVSGDLGSKSLPLLFKLLNSLPEGQVKQNDMLKSIVVSKEKGDSSHSKDDASIIINAGELSAANTKTYETAAGDVQLNSFTSTTLHEIGHSVDAAVRYMKSKGDDLRFGGWRTETPETILTFAVTRFKTTYASAATLADEIIKPLLNACLTTGDLPEVVPDEAIRTDATVVWCKAVYANHSNALWRADRGTAASVANDGRVYIESYAGEWWSYAIAARDQQVSNYQFRSPHEWFAEVYSVRMLGQLPTSHPCYADIPTLDARTPLAAA
jgi:hypothetical protein